MVIKKQRLRPKFFLYGILVLAAVLRFWALDQNPPELFGDELDVGYHAYSLLETGRDYSGQLLPTYIHSFSEWRAPLLMYVTAPFVAVFGLNEWGVRLPNAVLGVATILLLYHLVRLTTARPGKPGEVGGNWKLAIIASFFLAISPWHLQYSRAAFEVNLLLTLILGGTLAFIHGLKHPKWLSLAAILFGLTFYTYSTASIFVPLFALLLLLLHKKQILSMSKNKLAIPVVVSIIMVIPITYQVLFGFAGERFSNFSIFKDQEIIRNINLKRAESGSEGFIFYNKPIFWGRKILSNYGTAFSPQFLFIDGDVTFRHSIHEIGELYWIQLPFLVAGVLWFLQKRDKQSLFANKQSLFANKWAIFWVAWLLLAPIPSSLTTDGATHATRLILMLIPLTVLTAAGVNLFLESRFRRNLKRVLGVFVLLIVVVEFSLYFNRYWVDYPKESWRWWQTGYKEAMAFMKDQEDNYEIVAFNNTYEPALIRFLFWWQYPPDKFLSQFKTDKPSEDILPNFDGFSLGEKYYFGSTKEIDNRIEKFLTPETLYLASQRDEGAGDWDWEKDPPPGVNVLKTVRNPYGEPVFYIVTAANTD